MPRWQRWHKVAQDAKFILGTECVVSINRLGHISSILVLIKERKLLKMNYAFLSGNFGHQGNTHGMTRIRSPARTVYWSVLM